jgi:hypothetical protein
VASKSFASLRSRPIQAKKRSTTHRRGKTVSAGPSFFPKNVSYEGHAVVPRRRFTREIPPAPSRDLLCPAAYL